MEMGKYYETKHVENLGKPVQDTDYLVYGKYPKGHKRLAVVMDNGMFKSCPDVTSKEEFDYHYGNYARGSWLSFQLYSLPDDFPPPM